jgi:hypothetical protein
MTSTRYTAASVIDAVRLELQNSTHEVGSAFDEGFAKGAEWALANVAGRMKRADDLFRVMCDELTVIKGLRVKLTAAEARVKKALALCSSAEQSADDLDCRRVFLETKIAAWIDMTANCAGVPQKPDSLPQMLLHEFRAALAQEKANG